MAVPFISIMAKHLDRNMYKQHRGFFSGDGDPGSVDMPISSFASLFEKSRERWMAGYVLASARVLRRSVSRSSGT